MPVAVNMVDVKHDRIVDPAHDTAATKGGESVTAVPRPSGCLGYPNLLTLSPPIRAPILAGVREPLLAVGVHLRFDERVNDTHLNIAHVGPT